MEKDVLPPKSDIDFYGDTAIDFESLVEKAKENTGRFSNQFQHLNAYRINPESTILKVITMWQQIEISE